MMRKNILEILLVKMASEASTTMASQLLWIKTEGGLEKRRTHGCLDFLTLDTVNQKTKD